jgi:hypothetical protein
MQNSAAGLHFCVRELGASSSRVNSGCFEALNRSTDLWTLPVFFIVRPVFPKQSKVASLGRRLHKLGHRNVTIPLKTRWLTPAGLCVSTQ